jgi:BNR repeat protein/pectate lyase-like protein
MPISSSLLRRGKMTMHMQQCEDIARRVCLVLSIVGVLACGIRSTSSAAEHPATKAVYDVRDHGAVGDGKTLDTRAIQAAIDVCHKAGGGRIYLGGGTFLSGSIFLKSNVTLYRVVASRILVEHPGGMPALCWAGNGDLLLAYATNWQPIPPAGGTVKLIRSKDGGKTWSQPKIIVHPKDPEKWSIHMWSGLHRMPDGSLILYYGQNRSEEVTEAYVIRSVDHGKTWSGPIRLADEKVTWDGKTLQVPFTEGFGRGVLAPNGDFLAPIGARREGGFGGTKASAFVRSSDGGNTWDPLEFIATGNKKFSETTLGRAGDDLIAIIRCDTTRRQLWQSVSHDNGKTWSTPVLGVATNDKRDYLHGKMPDLLTLPSGRLLLAVGSVDTMDGGELRLGKSFSGLYISDDHGKTWRRDVMFPSADPSNMIPYDSPVLLKGNDDEILALSVQTVWRSKSDPRSGWTMGSHYVLHAIREVK